MYDAWCDMAGGGFTLVMKVDADDADFTFDSSRWTSPATLPFGTSSSATDASAWLTSARSVPVRRLRIGLVRAGVARFVNVTIGDNPAGLALVPLMATGQPPTAGAAPSKIKAPPAAAVLAAAKGSPALAEGL